MPTDHLTADHDALLELANRLVPDYVAFMQRLTPGDGGRAIIANEGLSRRQIKARLDAVAELVGITLHYLSGSSDEVVFEVVDVSRETPGER